LKAVVKTEKGKGKIEVRDVPIPEIASDEVLIKVHYAGICGTDVHIWLDEFPVYYPPVILGHEFSGEIARIGEDVSGWRVGDRVLSETQNLVCGKCYYCRIGHPEACEKKRSPGWGVNGSFAEYLKMPNWLIHKIPDNVSFEEAAVVEPAATAAQNIYSTTGVNPGDTVVVIGPGPIGLILAQMAQINGASWVMVIGTNVDTITRLPLAKKLGVDYVVNVDEEDPLELVEELTAGLGADVVFEATGAESAINQAFEVVRWKGKIGVIGLPSKEKLNIKWSTAAYKAIEIKFSFSSQYIDWIRVLKLLESGALNLKDLVTDEYQLDDWEAAFNKIVAGQAIKALLKP
jgi:L-iditol 2-dehydrogenase